MKKPERYAKPALLIALLLLGGIALGCSGHSTHVDLVIEPLADRYVTGFVYDDWDGLPVTGATVVVENTYDGTLYEGYTDYDGYFEIWVGEYFDFEDVYFRIWRISHPWYYNYAADDLWYGVDDSWEIYTGEYILYPR